MTLYYNAEVSTDWNDLGNWWTTNTAGALSDPASALPTAIDDVILTGSVVTNTGGAIEVSTLAMTAVSGGYVLGVDVLISGGGYNGIFTNSSIGAGVTVTGNCEFIGSQAGAVGAASNSGTITGNALFTGDVGVLPCVVAAPVENFGTVSGNAVFNGNSRNASTGTVTGTCAFNDNSYNDGTAAQVTYAGFTGSTCAGGFVILGAPASGLDSEGRGTYAVDGLYYTAYPTLAEGYQYQTGVYYFAGVATVTLDASGNGYNTVDGIYYIGGVSTAGALDQSGSGFYDGHAYYGGYLQPDGWNGFYYYLSDVSTEGYLDSWGNGAWQTQNYFGGVSAGVPGTDTRWLLWNGSVYGGDWNDPANWTIFSNVEWSGNYAIAAALPTAVDNCQTPDYTTPVSQLSGSVCGNIKIEYNGNYWGFYYVSGGPLTVNGTATVIGTNTIPMSGTGTANFTGSSRNMANITFGAINFRDTSSNAAQHDPYGTSFFGVCNVATFYDNATNAGGNYGIGLDITANSVANSSGYYSGVVTGASSFYNNSINYGGCLGVATFYDNAKNMLGLNGGVVLSYNKGINGTGILGIF